jgi:hypothetical protein
MMKAYIRITSRTQTLLYFHTLLPASGARDILYYYYYYCYYYYYWYNYHHYCYRPGSGHM